MIHCVFSAKLEAWLDGFAWSLNLAKPAASRGNLFNMFCSSNLHQVKFHIMNASTL